MMCKFKKNIPISQVQKVTSVSQKADSNNLHHDKIRPPL